MMQKNLCRNSMKEIAVDIFIGKPLPIKSLELVSTGLPFSLTFTNKSPHAINARFLRESENCFPCN